MKDASVMKADQAFLGRGWAFPPSFSRGCAEVEMVSNAEDIHQSLKLLLGTTRGERVMRAKFGCDLSSLVFEEIDRWLLGRVERMISDSILEHEPRVVLDRVDVSASDAVQGCLTISVKYQIRGTNSRFNMVFPFYLTEATLPLP